MSRFRHLLLLVNVTCCTLKVTSVAVQRRDRIPFVSIHIVQDSLSLFPHRDGVCALMSSRRDVERVRRVRRENARSFLALLRGALIEKADK